MRDGFLERLYRHRVTDARLAPLLSDLDGVRSCAPAALLRPPSASCQEIRPENFSELK